MLFPVLLILLFFLTLNFNHKVLYSPGDFQDERHFVRMADSAYTSQDASEWLQRFWKPDGEKVDKANEGRLEAWMMENDLQDISITAFLYGNQFSDKRAKAARDLQRDRS